MRREMPLWVVIVIVCVVGLAAGGGGVAGALYLEKRGPAGPPGPAGPRGPAGTGAEEALARAGDVEYRLSTLGDQLSAPGLDVGDGRLASVASIVLSAQMEYLDVRVHDSEI